MQFREKTFAGSASKAGSLVQMLLVAVFCALTAASSILDTASSPVAIETIGSSTNTSSIVEDLNSLHTRADTSKRPNVVFGSTCSDAQVTYLHISMSEAADLVCSHLP